MNAPVVSRNQSPYSLNSRTSGFYGSLSRFADLVTQACEEIGGAFLDGHVALQETAGATNLRSRGEYAVELLTLGILRNVYATLAMATPNRTIRRLHRLWQLRSRDASRKARSDSERASIFFDLLRSVKTSADTWCDDQHLCDWLLATGEFKEEALRMQTWLSETGIFWTREELQETSGALAQWFISRSADYLGSYTQDVPQFIQNVETRNEMREDLLLITRPEELYHLNMVGAEIMNRGFRPGFQARSNKVLLVPGCMRILPEHACKALVHGLDIECARCHKDCEVAKLTRLGNEHQFQVRIVPHASSFTAWLKHWQKDDTTALIAAACPLHLVPGGYEMHTLGLHAQCILLEYSGCKKHWSQQGQPTRINVERLLQLVR